MPAAGSFIPDELGRIGFSQHAKYFGDAPGLGKTAAWRVRLFGVEYL